MPDCFRVGVEMGGDRVWLLSIAILSEILHCPELNDFTAVHGLLVQPVPCCSFYSLFGH